MAVRRTANTNPQPGDDWMDASDSGEPHAWDEWDEHGILPLGGVPADWPEDRLRRAQRSARRRLLSFGAVMLVVVVVLAASLGRVIPDWGIGNTSGASRHLRSQPAAPVTITLFSPDNVHQAQHDPNAPLSTALPSGTQPPPRDYLPPDKPSAYEISLITAIGTPEKVIVVSTYSQTIHVYFNGAFIAGSYAITGRPGLPTPTGVWHIFYKLAPATLYSPWPPGSPYWYPPTQVQYTMEFKDGGFLIHDAPWHHVWGPGMNDWHYDPIAQEWQWGSHGCVNAPTPFVGWLYNWSPLGTTVLVY